MKSLEITSNSGDILQQYFQSYHGLVAVDEFGEEEKADAVAPLSSPPRKENIVMARLTSETKPVSPPSVRTVTVHTNVAPLPRTVDLTKEEYMSQPVGGRLWVVCVGAGKGQMKTCASHPCCCIGRLVGIIWNVVIAD